MIFAIGENSIGPSPCYGEVVALFSSTCSLGVDRVPFVVTIEEVKFHEENSEMGNEIGNIRHMLQKLKLRAAQKLGVE